MKTSRFSQLNLSQLNHGNASALVLALTLTVFAAACGGKKTPIAPPPPPPPSNSGNSSIGEPKPNITFTVEPSSLAKGQSAMLRWQVQNGTEFTIDQNVGPVGSTGQRQIYPNETTTYTLSAKGPGGSESKSVTVNVSTPPPPPPSSTGTNESSVDIINRNVKDIYFDYDKNDITSEARTILAANAEVLKKVFAADSTIVVSIEGNCDERGSAEYNVALGDRRATAAKEILVELGVSGDRLRTVSYGKEKPVCTDATEECYQRNRHDHFAPSGQ